MITFPNVKVTELVTKDALGMDTAHKDLPCVSCMISGEMDRHRLGYRATHLVEIADICKLPMCQKHAEEFMGDKR